MDGCLQEGKDRRLDGLIDRWMGVEDRRSYLLYHQHMFGREDKTLSALHVKIILVCRAKQVRCFVDRKIDFHRPRHAVVNFNLSAKLARFRATLLTSL